MFFKLRRESDGRVRTIPTTIVRSVPCLQNLILGSPPGSHGTLRTIPTTIVRSVPCLAVLDGIQPGSQLGYRQYQSVVGSLLQRQLLVVDDVVVVGKRVTITLI
jgi:hypothetical protein